MPRDSLKKGMKRKSFDGDQIQEEDEEESPVPYHQEDGDGNS